MNTQGVGEQGAGTLREWEITKSAEVPNGMPSLERSGASPESIDRFNEALGKFSHKDQINIEAAARFFSCMHAQNNQVRTIGEKETEPYANHILRVASRIVLDFGYADKDLVIAALGHDSVEDLKVLLTDKPNATSEEALEVLKGYIDERALEIIWGVTNQSSPEGVKTDQDEKNRRYVGHAIAAMRADPKVEILKLSDFADNGMNVSDTLPPERQIHFAKKYLPLAAYFLSRLNDGGIIEDDDKRAEMLTQVNATVTQFATLLK